MRCKYLTRFISSEEYDVLDFALKPSGMILLAYVVSVSFTKLIVQIVIKIKI